MAAARFALRTATPRLTLNPAFSAHDIGLEVPDFGRSHNPPRPTEWLILDKLPERCNDDSLLIEQTRFDPQWALVFENDVAAVFKRR